MAGVFVNYRRVDPGGQVRRLYEWLEGYFGEQLYKDTDGLRPGDDFARELLAAVSSSDVLLAVIGAGWAELTDACGRRRLEDQHDWVRAEIATALEAGIPVIPVLLPGASMPPAARLPDDLRALAARSPVRLDEESWADDVEELIARLEELGVRRQLIRIRSETAGRLDRFRSLRGHDGGVNDVAFSPDGLRVVTAGGLPNWLSVNRLDYNRPDYKGRRAAVADPTVRVWRVADGSVIHTLGPHEGLVTAVAIAPNGMMLASGDGRAVRLWDLNAGDEICALPIPGTAIAFSPDGALLAMGCYDGTVPVLRLTDGELLQTRSGHSKAVVCLAFSPGGDVLASGSYDGTVRLCRCSDWNRLATLRGGPLFSGAVSGSPMVVRDIAFAPDGKILAAACSDGLVRRWQVPSGKRVPPLVHREGSAASVAYAPDGSLLASGSGQGALLLWAAASAKPLELRTEGEEIRALAFSADGCTLGTAVWNGTAYLWRIRRQSGGHR